MKSGWAYVISALFLIVSLISGPDESQVVNCLASDDTAPPPSATESKNADTAEAQPTKPNRAELAAWRKNIAEWKEWEPGEPADNSFCYVCHANYEEEPLVTLHLPSGVGCETCHGISDKHSEDEDSLVPPDVVFAKSKITTFCLQCHEKDDLIDSAKDHELLFAAIDRPLPAAKQENTKICTDCHKIQHKLLHRTRRWNKETRELQWYDGVRMMQQRNK